MEIPPFSLTSLMSDTNLGWRIDYKTSHPGDITNKPSGKVSPKNKDKYIISIMKLLITTSFNMAEDQTTK